MGWETLLPAGITALSVVSAIAALTRGVTWMGWGEHILRRRTNPVGFWIMTVIWIGLSVLGLAWAYMALTRG